ncbi:MAG TPA: hypothetical protein IAA75_03765 [Candidatus Pullichristensenella avicola]|nr:hypothetical protein [Candidatus Pullichristensenella avicola]
METICKRLTLLMALLLALGGVAAAETPNPRQEMESAAQVEARLGFAVAAPENVEAEYAVIGGSTGEATFQVDQIACTLRAARTQDDISGLFMEMSEPVEEEHAAGEDVVSVAHRATEENGGYDVYAWFVDDVQYCLVLHGEASVMIAGEILEGVLEACAAAQ